MAKVRMFHTLYFEFERVLVFEVLVFEVLGFQVLGLRSYVSRS